MSLIEWGECMPPKVITIANQKGGTGKTTLSALLAYGLALRKRNVLMVDLDPQSHLSSFFLKINEIENVEDGVLELVSTERSKFRIRPVNLGIEKAGKVGLIPSGANYMIKMYSGQAPAWRTLALYSRIITEPAINRDYEYVVCDTPPELFPPTLWGLYAADYLIIPTNLEELSLAGIKLLLKHVIPDVIVNGNNRLKVLGVAVINVTRHVKPKSIKKYEDLFRRFIETLPAGIYNRIYKRPFFTTIIYRYGELRDLSYRPKRWKVPLSRVVNRQKGLKETIEGFAKEVEERIENLEGAL
jgi:chromosome partitioning protein